MTKRILVAADVNTNPVTSGNQQCIMQYVSVLRNLGYEVYYLYIDLYESKFLTNQTRTYWGEHFFYYRTPSLQIVLQKILRRLTGSYYFPYLDIYYPNGLTQYVNKLQKQYNFDGLIVNYIWNSKLANCDIPVKTIFTHDMFSDRNEKLGVKDAWYSFPVSEEAKGISRFKEILSIQEEESDWYRKLAPKSNVRTVYSSFDFVEQPLTLSNNVLFFSGGGQLNKDGISRFISDVWPLLKEKNKDIKLLLGGGICSCFKQDELPEDIILKGRYDNPDDFYALGDICINPIYSGSGLKIKTFEALAHGKLTIVDPHSAIGVYKPQSIPLYRAHSSSDYVKIISDYIGEYDKLMQKHQQCQDYIQNLNQYIQQQYAEVFK